MAPNPALLPGLLQEMHRAQYQKLLKNRHKWSPPSKQGVATLLDDYEDNFLEDDLALGLEELKDEHAPLIHVYQVSNHYHLFLHYK